MKTFKSYSKLVKKIKHPYWDGEENQDIKKPLKESAEDWLGTTNHEENLDEYHEANKQNGDKIHSKPYITDPERHSLGVYSGHNSAKLHNGSGEYNYKIINYHLRNEEKNPLVDEHVYNIDNALNKHITENNVHVWRGIAGLSNDHSVASNLMSMNPGDHFHDKGYTSTTINPHTASDFSRVYKNKDNIAHVEHHLAHIKVPKGSKAIYLNKHDAGIYYEHEVLLPRNSKFRYDGREEHPHPTDSTSKTIVHHLTHVGTHEDI